MTLPRVRYECSTARWIVLHECSCCFLRTEATLSSKCYPMLWTSYLSGFVDGWARTSQALFKGIAISFPPTHSSGDKPRKTWTGEEHHEKTGSLHGHDERQINRARGRDDRNGVETTGAHGQISRQRIQSRHEHQAGGEQATHRDQG
jgi:hypothetical protein